MKQGRPAATRGWKKQEGSSPSTFRESAALSHLDLRLPASGIVGINFCPVKSPVRGNLFRNVYTTGCHSLLTPWPQS